MKTLSRIWSEKTFCPNNYHQNHCVKDSDVEILVKPEQSSVNISVNQISSLKFHLKLGSIENLKAVRLHCAKVALADLAKNIYD